MKIIIATEEVLNDFGDLIEIVYHYEDGTQKRRKLFIPASMLEKRHKPLKG